MGIDEVLQKVEEEGNKKLKSRKEELNKQKKEIEKKYKQQYDQLTSRLENEKKAHKESAKQRTLAKFRSELRVEFLGEKRKIMNKTFQSAKQAIIELPDKEYANFFINRIKELKLKEGKLTIGKKDEKRLKKLLKKAFSNWEIKASDNFEHGVIAEYGKVSYDFTLDAIFNELTERLEDKIAEVIFG